MQGFGEGSLVFLKSDGENSGLFLGAKVKHTGANVQ
jgi:hypothetical protein